MEHINKMDTIDSEKTKVLTINAQLQLEKAKKLFYQYGACEDALEIIEPIYEKFGQKEVILELYLPILAEVNISKAIKIISNLKEDFISAYTTSIDIAFKYHDYDEAELKLRKAKSIFKNNILLDCYNIILILLISNKFKKNDFLFNASELFSELPNPSSNNKLEYSLIFKTALLFFFIVYPLNNYYRNENEYDEEELLDSSQQDSLQDTIIQKVKALSKKPDLFNLLNGDAYNNFIEQISKVIKQKNLYEWFILHDKEFVNYFHERYFTCDEGAIFSNDGGIPYTDEIIIPPSLNEEPVTLIGNIHTGDKLIGKILLPDGIITISEEAFKGNHCLMKIEIPDSVTNIEDSAFSDCSLLDNIIFSSGLKFIGNNAFSLCTNLKNVTINANLDFIGDTIFWGCRSIEQINITENVISLPVNIFDGLTGLNNIVVDRRNALFYSVDGVLYTKNKACLIKYPVGRNNSEFFLDGVETIGRSAFKGFKTLISIEIPSSVTTIEDEAFANCEELYELSLSEEIKTIGKNAFAECDKLKYVNLPKKLTSIGGDAFYSCRELTHVRIHNPIPPKVSYGIFYECEKLKEISVPKESVNAYKNTYGWEEYSDIIIGY